MNRENINDYVKVALNLSGLVLVGVTCACLIHLTQVATAVLLRPSTFEAPLNTSP